MLKKDNPEKSFPTREEDILQSKGQLRKCDSGTKVQQAEEEPNREQELDSHTRKPKIYVMVALPITEKRIKVSKWPWDSWVSM